MLSILLVLVNTVYCTLRWQNGNVRLYCRSVVRSINLIHHASVRIELVVLYIVKKSNECYSWLHFIQDFIVILFPLRIQSSGSSYPDRVERLHQEYLDRQAKQKKKDKAGDGFVEGSIDPPRALPVKGQDDGKKDDADDADGNEYLDLVYNIDAFCNLDCGADGECFMQREGHEGNVVRKRCLCPHGKYGERCKLGELLSRKVLSRYCHSKKK